MRVASERSSSTPTSRRWFVRTDVPVISIAVAVACVGLATAARLLLGVLLGPTLMFAAFYPAVLVASLVGGPIAGLTAVALSVLSAWWALSEPVFQFGVVSIEQVANLAVFAASSFLVVWLASVHRQLLSELESKEAERVMLAREIQHRSQNIIAVVSSLVRQTVKDQEAAETLVRRMSLMASSDRLLAKPNASSGSLMGLLRETVCKAHGDRIMLVGDESLLSAEQSHSLALVFHEMTTNALKYGALSESDGKVRIEWTNNGSDLTIYWLECDGPAAAAPSRHNFGSKLIKAMLDQINGRIEPTYARAGYCYKIVLPI